MLLCGALCVFTFSMSLCLGCRSHATVALYHRFAVTSARFLKKSDPLASNGKCFFPLLHDSRAKRPARCERFRCLYRDSARWASARCFVKATELAQRYLQRGNISCMLFRVNSVSPLLEFGKFGLLLGTALGEVFVAVRPVAGVHHGVHHGGSNKSRRLCPRSLHGPRSPSQPLYLRKNTAGLDN